MKPTLNINESFICKIWEGGVKYYNQLSTVEGDDIEIISFGKRNSDAGPDYLNAKIKIGGKTLSGDVEIHRDFTNWAEHRHFKDRKYNSVILQVVLWDSKERTAPKLRLKRDLPTVILSSFLKNSIHDTWQDIIIKPEGNLQIPCFHLNNSVEDTLINEWLDVLAMERLKLKTGRVKERLAELEKETGLAGKDKKLWEQVLYEFIFEALGFSKNKEQMLNLAKSLNLQKLKKLLQEDNSLTYLQSVLFGTGGFLFDLRLKDDYITEIKSVWKAVEPQITVQKLALSTWNFFRMRPQNFPTIRIAYGSHLIRKLLYEDLFRNIILQFKSENFAVKKCYKLLYDLFKPQHDKYWETHYNLGKLSKSKNKLLGMQRFTDIVVNVIVPVVYLYSVEFKDKVIKENIIQLYNGLDVKPDNSIVKLVQKQLVKKRGITINVPSMEQAVIQLYNFYCVRERCGECHIGRQIFSDKGYEYKIIFY